MHYTMGYDNTISNYDPNTMNTATKVSTMLEWAQDAGMDTGKFFLHSNNHSVSCFTLLGIVTTARITHATPAAMYAHVYDRFYECDSAYEFFPDAPPNGVHDIAWQLVNTAPGNKTKVLIGGGYPSFYPLSRADDMRNHVNNCIFNNNVKIT